MKIKISPQGGFICSVSITKVAFYSGHFLSRFFFISLLHEIQGSIFLTMSVVPHIRVSCWRVET